MCSIKKLLELARAGCHEVDCMHTRQVSYKVVSSYTEIEGTCPNGHPFHWLSSNFHSTSKNAKISDTNLLMASGTVLSGNSYAKIAKFFRFMRVAFICQSSFYDYQRHFICPAVNKFYMQEQVCAKVYYSMMIECDPNIEQYKNTGLVLAGDGRCDSPGKIAKFCTYSVMVSDTNHILHFENADKREVALRSPNMEREGMRHCLEFLLAKGLTVEELITDASSAVAKMLGMYSIVSTIYY